jgi:hypothetical protein
MRVRNLYMGMALMMVCAISGCSSSHSAPTKTAVAKAAVITKPRIGYTAILNGHQAGDQLEVTLLGAVDPDPTRTQLTEAPAGTHYVSFQIRIANSRNSPKTYTSMYPFGVTAQDAEGQYMETAAFADTKAGAHLPTHLSIAPGDQALGYISFKVPDGSKVTTVQMSVTPTTAAAAWDTRS